MRAEVRIAELLAAVEASQRRADERVDGALGRDAPADRRSAAASCTSRTLLLLDEPESNLDAEGRELGRHADRAR